MWFGAGDRLTLDWSWGGSSDNLLLGLGLVFSLVLSLDF